MKMVYQPRYDLEVGRFLFQADIVEKLEERRKGRIHIRKPQKKHLLKDDLPVRDPLRVAVQVICDADLVLVHPKRRKGVNKMMHCALDVFPAKPFIQRRERLRHRFFVDIIPVLPGDVVEDLVDEPHGDQLPCLDRSFGKAYKVFFFVDLLGKDAGSVKVREDDVAAERKKGLAETVEVPRSPGDVEFHCRGAVR